MKLSDKIKDALEETRILILGAQVLLGFGFRGVFNDGFDGLPPHARYVDGAGLGLLVCTVGLLMAPGPYHRIVGGGHDSGELLDFVTTVAELALLPFALALGIDVFIGAERVFGGSNAIAAGIVGAFLALAFWYGLPELRKQFVGKGERMLTRSQRHERPETPLQVRIEQLLVESRVILPGAQALFGFQLAIVLTQSFEQLPTVSRIVHGASLFMVALAIVLLMAPAPYHRIVYAGEDTPDMYHVSSILIIAATLPLGLGLAGDIYVVIAKIAGSYAVGISAGGFALLLLSGLWYIYPFGIAAIHTRKRKAGGS